MSHKKISEYTVKFKPDGEGGYIVRVPAFPQIVTGGRTLAEAEEMAKDAIELCLEYYTEQGRSLPRNVDYKAVARSQFFKLAVAVK